MREREHSCPGCGQKKWFKLKGAVCHDCHAAIRRVQESKAELDNRTGERRLYSIGSAAHFQTYVSHDVSGFEKEHRKSLRELFHALAFQLSDPVDGVDWERTTKSEQFYSLYDGEKDLAHSRYSNPVVRLVRPDLHDLLDLTFQTVRERLDAAYREGQERGRNILLQLNAGEISLADFERKS